MARHGFATWAQHFAAIRAHGCAAERRVTDPRATCIGSDMAHPGIEVIGTYRKAIALDIRATGICIQEISTYSCEIGI